MLRRYGKKSHIVIFPPFTEDGAESGGRGKTTSPASISQFSQSTRPTHCARHLLNDEIIILISASDRLNGCYSRLIDPPLHNQKFQKALTTATLTARFFPFLYEKTPLKPPLNRYLNIIIDTTFFGHYFGVLVLMDSNSNNVISHYFVRTEKDIYYKLALNRLREKDYIIQSITCDGRRGLMKDLFNAPVQMCQFHMVAIVMRKLRKKHQSQAGKELKIIVKTLTSSSKNEFYQRLHSWFIKHQDFLKERSDKANEKGDFPYKHRK